MLFGISLALKKTAPGMPEAVSYSVRIFWYSKRKLETKNFTQGVSSSGAS